MAHCALHYKQQRAMQVFICDSSDVARTLVHSKR